MSDRGGRGSPTSRCLPIIAVAGAAAAGTAALVAGIFGPGTWSAFLAGRRKGALLLGGAVLAAATAVATSTAGRTRRGARQHGESEAFANYPRQYVAHRSRPLAVIDGDVHKPEWQAVPWSDAFVEIRGERDAPLGSGPKTSQGTRMKMMWDDQFLYIAAEIDLDVGDELVARFTERNSPIFHTDSDFEVFVDPSGCCHGYKELEMNAINTVWNLMLSKPYSDGGGELSGRVAKAGEASYWEVKGQKTATKITRGALNTPSAPSRWSCEIALSHEDNLSHQPVRGPAPAVGAFWRINFSRVEQKGEVNWVWSPQVVWTPAERRYMGQVNMHLPDAWGYVVFADAAGRLPHGASAAEWRDPAWPARHAASSLYYAAKAFRDSHGRWPTSLQDLQRELLVDANALVGVEVAFELLVGTAADACALTATFDGWTVRLAHDRLLQAFPAV